MRLELRHLEVLVAVADSGSIRKAAQLLQVAQPGVTAQLHRIESTVGVRLFHRHHDGVTLTEPGRYAITRARELLAGLDDLTSTLHTLARGEDPLDALRVGGVAGPFVTSLVHVLHELLPGPEIPTVMEPMVGKLLDQVVSGKLDVAVVHEFPGFAVRAPDGVELRTLIAAEPIFAMVAETHPASGGTTIDLADLAGDDWVMMTPDDTGLYSRLRIICEAAGFTPRFRHAANDSSAAVSMVAEGQAVSGMYPTGRQLPGVTVRPITGNPHYRRIMLAWRPGSEIADTGDEIAEQLLERYFALADDRPHYAQWLAVHGRDAITQPDPGRQKPR